MNHFGIPGVGGSLGICALCGKCFALEVITGTDVTSFKMEQFTQTLYAHHDCFSDFEKLVNDGGDWQQLPDGPIKKGFVEIASKQEKGNIL